MARAFSARRTLAHNPRVAHRSRSGAARDRRRRGLAGLAAASRRLAAAARAAGGRAAAYVSGSALSACPLGGGTVCSFSTTLLSRKLA